MVKHDKSSFERHAIDSLMLNRQQQWLDVTDIQPKSGHRVLLYGRNGSQEVGSFDGKVGMWVIRNEPVPFDNFTHWKFLTGGPDV